MDQIKWRRNRVTNALHSLLLVMSLAALLGVLGGAVGGRTLAFVALGTAAILYFISPLASPYFILRLYRGRRLAYHEAPRLCEVVEQLSRRAGLTRRPDLYFVPSDMVNALTVGTGESAAIMLSNGLLRRLSRGEINAVLAHEISHIRHRDTGIMGFAVLTSQLIHTLSFVGQLVLLFHLPLILLGIHGVSLGVILLVLSSPWISALIQHALSRTREYAADLSAAELLGDPVPLARALAKLENYRHGLLRRILWSPYPKRQESAAWRTHPPTAERIRRLLAMREPRLQAIPNVSPSTHPAISVHPLFRLGSARPIPQ